jgi:hypothetical protein
VPNYLQVDRVNERDIATIVDNGPQPQRSDWARSDRHIMAVVQFRRAGPVAARRAAEYLRDR